MFVCLITAVCVASKFLDDSFYPNSFYAQLGGIPLEELIDWRVEFLFSLNFSLHVSPSEYDRYYAGLRLRSHSLFRAEPRMCVCLRLVPPGESWLFSHERRRMWSRNLNRPQTRRRHLTNQHTIQDGRKHPHCSDSNG